MKAKVYIFAALAACATVGFTSCSDMLKVDSKVVLYAEDNDLSHATDTVYSVMGIINGLQKIADRTVLLGEIRGDLVTTTDHATDDLREIAKFDFGSIKEGNKYDKAVDYYAIINNCNYFLSNVDTAYYRNNESVFMKEYVAVLCFRAWTYLQLAQVYGAVPFVRQPVLSETDALPDKYPVLTIKQLADSLLVDFKPEFANVEMPRYGNLGGGTNGDGTTAATHKAEHLFIPYHIMLGDLYLWAEKYPEAAIEYHAYLTDEDNPVHVGTASILWLGPDFMYLGEDSYSSLFGEKSDPITYIPMEAEKYGGYVSDLANVFNSTKDNDYWNQATRSNALTFLSANQDYCYHKINEQSNVVVPTKMQSKQIHEDDILLMGDLRLQSILKVKAQEEDAEDLASSLLNSKRQTLNKINKEKICLYRSDVVYLRLAEALNRAGLPNTAFYVLKCGLNYDTFYYGTSYQSIDYSDPIYGTGEYYRAVAKGMQEVYDWDDSEFWLAERERVSTTRVNTELNGHKIPADYVVYYAPTGQNVKNRYLTMGIHSRGCGNADIDSLYRINVQPGASLTDSIRAVEELIINEMALETCFEGYRFGDLLRMSIHRASDAGYPNAGGFADNDFLAKHVAARETATMEDYTYPDASLYGRLRGDGKSFNKEWFLRLPGINYDKQYTHDSLN